MNCVVCKQNIYDIGLAECPFCKTPVNFPETLAYKYREALRNRVAHEGLIATLKEKNLLLKRQIIKQRNGYVLTILLLTFLSSYLFLRRKPDTVPVSIVKRYSDSLYFYKNWVYTLQNQRSRSLKYVIGNKDSNRSLGNILFSDPAVGYKVLKDNGIDTNRWSLRRFHVGDTIIFNFK